MASLIYPARQSSGASGRTRSRHLHTSFPAIDQERQGGLAPSASTACGDRSELRARFYQPEAGSAQDDYWAGRVCHDVLAHRAKEHACEATVAA